jgi:hypothetical protein
LKDVFVGEGCLGIVKEKCRPALGGGRHVRESSNT